MIKAYPNSLNAWYNLGAIRFQQHQPEAARDAFQHATAIDPKDAASFAGLGVVQYQLNSFADAITALKQAIALNPNDAKSHNYLACSYEKSGMPQEAQIEFQKAGDLDKSAH
jgi:cytochrome c-type biogenesis protein CcmH/NrfG